LPTRGRSFSLSEAQPLVMLPEQLLVCHHRCPLFPTRRPLKLKFFWNWLLCACLVGVKRLSITLYTSFKIATFTNCHKVTTLGRNESLHASTIVVSRSVYCQSPDAVSTSAQGVHVQRGLKKLKCVYLSLVSQT